MYALLFLVSVLFYEFLLQYTLLWMLWKADCWRFDTHFGRLIHKHILGCIGVTEVFLSLILLFTFSCIICKIPHTFISFLHCLPLLNACHSMPFTSVDTACLCLSMLLSLWGSLTARPWLSHIIFAYPTGEDWKRDHFRKSQLPLAWDNPVSSHLQYLWLAIHLRATV